MSINGQEQDARAPQALRRVLIVERDPASVHALQASLAEAGFAVTVLDGGEDALEAIDRDQPHLVMLDWEHPAVAAQSLIRHIQRDEPSRRARLIALSLYSTEQEIVTGFELGVDDYVVRPYSLPVLVARVRAVLRAAQLTPEEPDALKFHRLRLDLTARRLMVGAQLVPLRPMEYRLLEFLMRHPERVFTRAQLINEVWPREARVDGRAVDVNVQRARKMLAHYGCGEYFQTVRAVGYRLSARGL